MKEIWNLYTKDRIITEKLHERGNIIPIGYFHLVVEIWTIIKNNKILITQRHKNKPFGLLWECTGGSVIQNETSLEGAIREVKEEIGLEINKYNMELVHKYIGKDTIYDVYINYQNEECLNTIKLQKDEVINMKCVSLTEFNELLEKGEIIPKLVYLNELIRNKKIRLTTASTG
jgi:8-oxo-dGTP diphosphatase